MRSPAASAAISSPSVSRGYRDERPQARHVGLSATIAWPEELAAWLGSGGKQVHHIAADDGPLPRVDMLEPGDTLPWAGHMALYAMGEVYEAIERHKSVIVFVNTRAQAELVFQELWRRNDKNLPIALHHGSLAVEQRCKVEAAMAEGKLRAVVATSSLDLGIDWGDIDLVIQIGAPKGVSRLTQRIGRANHRLNEASAALLVPANRFEVLECRAAIAAIGARELDGDKPRAGGLDVLAQHILGMACAAPFTADALYEEVTSAAPYRVLPRKDFDDALAFVEHGGYALREYEQWRRLFHDSQGRYNVVSPPVARRYRMNIGTIVEAVMLRVRVGGRVLGEVEENFALGLSPGDTFLFSGEILRFEEIRGMEVRARRERSTQTPKIPSYDGGKFPLSTHLAARVRGMLQEPRKLARPAPARSRMARRAAYEYSVMPDRDGLLVESFPRGPHHYFVVYGFEGRPAHQTLGMLLTKRMERAGSKPLGFVATDYVLAVWSLEPARDIETLLDQEMLGDDLEVWMAESSMLRRSFRNVAIIAGLIERNHPGHEKSAAAGHLQLRPHLRRAAPPPARSHPAARNGCRCRNRAHRYSTTRRNAGPRQGPHHLPRTRSRLAAGDSHPARSRPRGGLRRGDGRAGRRGRGTAHRGSRATLNFWRRRHRSLIQRGMRVLPPQNEAAGRLLLNGVELFAEPSGALWWPVAATLIVADLHLEKGTSYATRGVLLPPYDTRTTLARLAEAIGPRVRRVICLGDSFHDGDGPERSIARRYGDLAYAGRAPRLDLDRRQSRSDSAGDARRTDGRRRASTRRFGVAPPSGSRRHRRRSAAIIIRNRISMCAAGA